MRTVYHCLYEAYYMQFRILLSRVLPVHLRLKFYTVFCFCDGIIEPTVTRYEKCVRLLNILPTSSTSSYAINNGWVLAISYVEVDYLTSLLANGVTIQESIIETVANPCN